jgi:hypothetical protein
MPYVFEENRTDWSVRYHVPRSQVWEGSRGGQSGNVHLHLPIEPRERRSLTAVNGRRTSIERNSGAPLCNRYGWYDRDPMSAEQGPEHRCPRCVALAERYGIEWPTETGDSSD